MLTAEQAGDMTGNELYTTHSERGIAWLREPVTIPLSMPRNAGGRATIEFSVWLTSGVGRNRGSYCHLCVKNAPHPLHWRGRALEKISTYKEIS